MLVYSVLLQCDLNFILQKILKENISEIILFYEPELMNVLRFTKSYNVHTNNNNETYRNNAVLIFFMQMELHTISLQ